MIPITKVIPLSDATDLIDTIDWFDLGDDWLNLLGDRMGQFDWAIQFGGFIGRCCWVILIRGYD